MGRYLLL